MTPRAVLALSMALAVACTHYVRRPEPPAEVLATAEAHRALVWRGAASIDVLFPRVVGDSLVAWKVPPFGSSPGERIAMSLEDVDAVALEEWDPASTGMVLTGAGLLWYLLLTWMYPET